MRITSLRHRSFGYKNGQLNKREKDEERKYKNIRENESHSMILQQILYAIKTAHSQTVIGKAEKDPIARYITFLKIKGFRMNKRIKLSIEYVN